MIRDKYSWNKVYNLVMKIKDDYNKNFNDNERSFEKWISKINKKEYNDIFECLQVNQDKDILLIRYGLADMQDGMWKDKDSIYRECRSLVIDLKNEEIILAPFRKFFNLNEVEENNLESVYKEIAYCNSFEVTDKLDGSMQSARYYNGDIFMAGSMAINKDNSWRLQEGYSMLSENYINMIKENPNLTFIFEYISQKDAHVVLYNKALDGLYLIGIRNVLNGYQYSYKEIKLFSKYYNVPMTDIENKNITQLLREMKEFKSYQKEGWVINIDGHMIKLKCDDYVHLHRLLDKFSSVNVIIENVAEDRIDDMLSKIPDNYKDRVLSVAKNIIKYKTETLKLVNDLYYKAPKNNKKEFMLWVDKNCPNDIKGYVRNLFLGKSFNVLKKNNNSYKKLKDLNSVEYYCELFTNREE